MQVGDKVIIARPDNRNFFRDDWVKENIGRVVTVYALLPNYLLCYEVGLLYYEMVSLSKPFLMKKLYGSFNYLQ
jgi:hypothetical protein